MFKRLMSMVLAFVMVLSVCPVSVWAEETVESADVAVVEPIEAVIETPVEEEPAPAEAEAVPEEIEDDAAAEEAANEEAEETEAPLGSESNPIENFGEFPIVTPEIAAGETLYYSVYGATGLLLSVDSADAAVVIDGEAYSGGAIGGSPRQPVSIAVTNNAGEAKSFTLTLEAIAGTIDNPADLILGQNEAVVGTEGTPYYYTWTASESGTLTLTIDEAVNGWQYQFENLTTYVMGDLYDHDYTPEATATEVSVNAGETLLLMIGTYDPENWFTAPAGSVTFTVSFKGLPGSQSNPIENFGEFPIVTPEIAAGQTLYYSVYGAVDMVLVIDDAEVSVTIDGAAYNGGTITGSPRTPVIIAVTNNGSEAKSVTLNLEPPVGTIDNPAELAVGQNVAVVGGNGQPYYYVWTAPETGVLSLTIDEAVNGWQYQFENLTTYVMGDLYDHDWTPEATSAEVAVAEGDQVRLMIGTYDPENWFTAPEGTVSFTVSFGAFTEPTIKSDTDDASGKPVISWEAVPGAVEYKVYRATSKNGKYSLKKTVSDISYTDTSAKAGTTYYYKVKAVDANGKSTGYSNYKSVTCDLAQPVIELSNVASSGKIKISWSKVSGAKKYEVRRSTDGENWTLVKTTTSTSYTNTTAKAGVTYFYKVRAIASKSSANSAYSLVESLLCKLARPVVDISGDSATGKIELEWDDISGAKEYIIYRETAEEGTFETELARVEDDEFTDTTAAAGIKYYYCVVAASENAEANSAKSLVDSRTCDLARPVVTLTAVEETGKTLVSWEAIEGAKEYKVYRATSKSGTYSLVNTTAETEYTDTKASAGKTYYYKVRAIHENTDGNSAYSSIKSRTADLAQPELTITETSSGKAKLSWKKVSGAKEYKVYRSTDEGETWSLLKTTTSTSYTNTSVKDGNVYLYRVRAIHKSSAANSAYSANVQFAARGSELNPYIKNAEEFPLEIAKISAGQTLYYSVRGTNGMFLTVEGSDVTVTVDGNAYNGEIISGSFYQPTVIAVTNNGAEAQSVTLTLTLPTGTMDNPAELVLGENTVTVGEDGNLYYYTWTAEESGTLTITIGEAANGWQYEIDNMTTGIYGDLYDHDWTPEAVTTEVSVNAGETLSLMIGTYDPDNWFAAPAGTVTFTVSFAAENGDFELGENELPIA